MSNRTKIWLIAAVILTLAGCILLGGAMSMINWDFSKLSTSKYITNTHEIPEPFSHISVTSDTADIRFVPSENEKCTVVCCEQENVIHNVAVADGTLVIRVNDTRKWYEHIGFHFGTPNITVYLPASEYGTLSVRSDTGDVEIPRDFHFHSIDVSESTGDVANYASTADGIKIKTSTGRISVESVSAKFLDLSASTGDITVSNAVCEGGVTVNVSTGKTLLTAVSCNSVRSDGSTGSISLSSVIAADTITIKRSTGRITFEKSDASEIFVKTDTGDVKGTLLSDKVFITKTDTGRIRVPDSVKGGRCEITTDTGDIHIEVVDGN